MTSRRCSRPAEEDIAGCLHHLLSANHALTALDHRLDAGDVLTEALLCDAIREGAVLRVRPKAMTVAVVLAGLIPIMLGHGAGSEVMQRIAAPMVGGMVTAPLLSMFVIPAAWLLVKRRQVRRSAQARSEFDGPLGAHVPSTHSGEMK
jgi:Cu(I)/Ag(I) efflux system membrane protein CusA/SilA